MLSSYHHNKINLDMVDDPKLRLKTLKRYFFKHLAPSLLCPNNPQTLCKKITDGAHFIGPSC